MKSSTPSVEFRPTSSGCLGWLLSYWSVWRGSRALWRFTSCASQVRLLVAVLTVLGAVGYCWGADEGLSAGVRPADAASTEGGSTLPQEVADALRSRRAELAAEGTSEQPGEPEAATIESQQAIAEPEPGLSTIEQLLSGQLPDVESIQLVQFGYRVFSRPVSTFAPVTNVPVGPDYVVGPGDSFTVTLWGRVNQQYPVTVDRSGGITLPEVGVLRVSGMSFAKLQDYLQNEFSRKYTDFKIAVTMGRLRTIRVFVVGEAQMPGGYTVSSLSTVINALMAAGGPSKNGTLRKIRLSRSQKATVTIDLYDFLLGGDKSSDVRLENGDTIYVPLIGPVVGVGGNVKRPAIYEMSEPMTLSEVLELSGGVTFAGWLQHVQVERVENHQRRIVVDFDISEKAGTPTQREVLNTVLRDGDVVQVFSVSPGEQNVIYLEGHVVRPGKYELKLGMRLGDLVDSYQVLQPQANLEFGEIVRLVEPDLHPIVIPFDVGKLLEGDESQNLEMARFDTVRIFRWDERAKQVVSISGAVYRPGEHRLTPDMRISDLIDTAGGLDPNAYLKTAELTRRHISQRGMQTEKIDIDLEKALAGVPEHDVTLQDYDHMIVRTIPELEFDRMARISGEVTFPGTYPIYKGETLSSLIERAGGYTERAYLKGAVFVRESAKVVQQQRMDELIRHLEESAIVRADQAISGAIDKEGAESQQASLQARRELLAKLRAAKTDGRVVVRLTPLEELKASKYDLELEKGDRLVVPETPGTVNVVGEVFNPASLIYEDARTVSYYLWKVGGATKEADEKQMSIIRADGSVLSMGQKRPRGLSWDSEYHQWSFRGSFMSAKLYPGDTIVVPMKMDKVPWLRTTKDITQILFQAALTTGVVLAL